MRFGVMDGAFNHDTASVLLVNLTLFTRSLMICSASALRLRPFDMASVFSLMLSSSGIVMRNVLVIVLLYPVPMI